MTQKKSEITVRKASEMAFQEMPDTFSAVTFCSKVKSITGRFMLMDGSILRRLREARSDNQSYHYRCIDNERSIYQKGFVHSGN